MECPVCQAKVIPVRLELSWVCWRIGCAAAASFFEATSTVCVYVCMEDRITAIQRGVYRGCVLVSPRICRGNRRSSSSSLPSDDSSRSDIQESDSNGKWLRGCPLAFPPKASNLKTSRRRHRLVEARVEATADRWIPFVILFTFKSAIRLVTVEIDRETKKKKKISVCQKRISIQQSSHFSKAKIIRIPNPEDNYLYNFPNAEFVVPKKDDTTG